MLIFSTVWFQGIPEDKLHIEDIVFVLWAGMV